MNRPRELIENNYVKIYMDDKTGIFKAVLKVTNSRLSVSVSFLNGYRPDTLNYPLNDST